MTRSRLDLKLRLTLQIAALMALCLVGAVGWLLLDGVRAGEAQVARIADLMARDLAFQRQQMQWVRGAPGVFPDLQRLAPALMAPGLCIAFRPAGAEGLQRLCSGAEPDDGRTPELFQRLYDGLFGARGTAERMVEVGWAAEGVVTVSLAPETLAGRAWREVSRLAVLVAAMLLVLCALVYLALARALRPTRIIGEGLDRLTRGDLSARMPAFDLAELSAVGQVFNALAARLQAALDESRSLTRRLIAVQDEERRSLARELHDEFGQSLAAIGAVAALAGQTAARDCPALVPECQSIGRTAQSMMQALRGALLRLRPPEVEELGLVASLEGLVSGWSGRLGTTTRFSLDVTGPLDPLEPAFAAGLYRIAQEAITNAAKHAGASSVRLLLARETGPAGDVVTLTVEDDGRGAPAPAADGFGLLGMRERVAAMGGELSIGTAPGGGLLLRARLPLPAGEAAS
ncbi:sensor histidine kinase [Xanthobacter aminoxidans]|uniref:sensor histidine kinase n=1 Tax=Xanthobacter aminoxidans TaxID=186280 RepID=UPI0037271E90